MSNVTSLVALSAASLVALYNSALDDYGTPDGFAPLGKVKRKAVAIEAIEALCEAGSLAVSFDSGTATIIDASGRNPDADGDEGESTEGDGDEGDSADGDEGENADGDGDEGDDEGESADASPRFGDGKGKARAWGFVLGSDEWLAANPRGTSAREAYRKARRAAARQHRKALRAAAENAAE